MLHNVDYVIPVGHMKKRTGKILNKGRQAETKARPWAEVAVRCMGDGIMKGKERARFGVALLWLGIAVVSLWISVVSYTPPGGDKTTYAIQNLIDGETFSEEVLSQYTGSFRVDIGPWALVTLCVLAVAAIAAAIIGILIMSKQRPIRWPFVMTVVGVIGTAIPSLAVFCAVVMSASYFPGVISPGVYPIVTPFATALCLYFVTKERKRIKKAAAAQKRNAFIYKAGDL